MNGSRSHSSRPGGTSSLDALSRTIEGLEARIEGLMSAPARDARPPAEEPRRAVPRETSQRPAARSERYSSSTLSSDPLAEIRQRQRALDAAREPVDDRYARPARQIERPRSNLGDIARPVPADRHKERTPPDLSERRPPLREPLPPLQQRTAVARQPVAHPPAPAVSELATKEITQALINLRQDLKKDISEGFTKEIETLRSEMRAIRAVAEKQQGGDLREDLSRLAEGIKQLGERPQDGTDGLRAEFEDLRSLMDGLAREDSVRSIGSQWTSLGDTLEDRFQALEPIDMREDISALADRLDAIREQMGAISDTRSVRVLEEKLIAVATALEQIGSQFDPQERALTDQFQGIDRRLDEISRAIAAGVRSAPSPIDQQVIARLEDRLSSIGHQIDTLTDQALTRDDSWNEPVNDLGLRIEALTARIEDLAQDHAASRLEERIEQLTLMVEEAQRPMEQPELAIYLADISRKIDALDHGAVNDRLAERLDYLARRIDELEIPAPPPPPAPAPFDDRLFRSLAERLDLITERLNETTHAPAEDAASLRGLEEQIAQLSMQLSTVPSTTAHVADNSVVEHRIAALEDYMATSDEYIVEAARQAAEAVMETYSQQSLPQGGHSHGNMETLAALADNLKHLENISRGSEERTSRTFEALQDTLLQIADRLDHIDRPAAFQPAAVPPQPEPTTRPASRAALAEMAQAKVNEQETIAATVRWEPEKVDSPTPEMTSAVSAMLNEVADERKSPKPSLLAGLGRKLLPGQKGKEPLDDGRVRIGGAPSVDPGDMLPPEEANELLEPGSGTPDVRKILERVRASQQEQRNRGDSPTLSDADRTDYIAAARRAAQAAAEEMERTPHAPAFHDGNGQASKDKTGTVISRYRRPIMMAIGAILLAAMAMPLVNTLTRGSSAPQLAVETTAPSEAAPAAIVAEQAAETSPPANAEEMPSVAEAAPPQTESFNTPMDAAPVSPVSGQDEVEILQNVPPAADAASVTGTQPEVATAIVVPEEITPPSLALAARDGDPLALFEIAARYTEGRGVTADMAKAATWYQHAADRGFAPALYRLGNLYEKGSGVERNLDTAKRHYEAAAAKGNASAMHNLAVIYASGVDGTQDYSQAANWFERAADLGVTDSQFNLAILYARGNGISQDLVASYKWFAIAAKEGDKDAAQKRDEVANSMRPEQLEQARAAVDSWKTIPLDVDANSVNTPDEWVGTGVKTASVDMKKAVQNIQAILNRNGYDAGVADGVMGKKTVAAIKAFQTSVGQDATGMVTDELVKALLERNK